MSGLNISFKIAAIDGFSGTMKKLDKDIKDTVGGLDGLGSSISRIGTMLAGLGAGAAFVGFTKGAIESAAEMEAISAQFEQVFGDMQGDAASAIDGMAKEFGMVGNRIKPSLTMMTSMFKGLGLSTEDALKQAESAVTLVADAAAFYDMSFENANAALNSFVKGNYEGGEAIGLFANETQMAAWAAENLGVDWKALDEAGKQVTRLQFAQAMQEAAGATGQASRESDSYQNQLGNLKQTWTDLLVQFGSPILGTVIDILKSMQTTLSTTDFTPWIDGFSTIFNKAVEIATFIKDNWTTIGNIIIGITTATAAFVSIMGAMNIIKTVTGFIKAWQATTLVAAAAQYGLNAAMLANPITWIVGLIAGLIAVGVLLWKNWDTVKIKLAETWEKIKKSFSNAFTSIKNTMENVKKSIITTISNAVNFIKNIDLKQVGINLIKGLWNGINSVRDWILGKISGFVGDVVGGIKDFFGINSPSKVLRDEVGRWIPAGLVQGIYGMKNDVLTAAEQLTAWATPGVPDVSMAYTTPNGSYNTLSSAVRGTVEVNSRDDMIATAIRELKNDLSGMQVVMDGREVGILVAPTVSRQIAWETQHAMISKGYSPRRY